MIDITSQLASIEKLMDLMTRYDIDEVSCDFLNIKKSKHKPANMQVPLDAQSALEKHVAPLPNEPWNAIPQGVVDEWAEKGAP